MSNSMYALVTGASSGIGRHYATQLARDYHYNILLVSNQEKELHEVAEELHTAYQVETRTLCLNLAEQDAAEQVYRFCETEGLDIRVLINNAGILVFDSIYGATDKKVETLVMLHVVTMTKLCQLFSKKWLEEKAYRHQKTMDRYILNMSSMSAWMAMPSIQCYNASKAYVLSFSRSIWYELKPFGVRVLAMTPGSTATGLLPFPSKFGQILKAVGITMEADRLVKKALHQLFCHQRKQYMPGAWNKIIVPIINHLPDWLVFMVMKRMVMFK